MRIAAVAIVMALLISTGAYGLKLQADNERLQADVDTAVEANSSLTNAMHLMAQEQVRQNRIIIERDRSMQQMQRDWARTQRRLDDAQRNPVITTIQRECMDSGIPEPVLDVLRETPHRRQGGTTGEDLPACCTLLGDGGATVRGQHLGGPGSLRQGVASAHLDAQQRPRGGSGVL